MDEQPSFKSLEQQGWNERADGYDVYTARITSPGIAPLIDAARWERRCKIRPR
jgi:hypothetical protein